MKRLLILTLLSNLAWADWTEKNGRWQMGGNSWINPTSQWSLRLPSSWKTVEVGPTSTRVVRPMPDTKWKVFVTDRALESISPDGTAFMHFYVYPKELKGKALEAYNINFWANRPARVGPPNGQEVPFASDNWGGGSLPFETKPAQGVFGYRYQNEFVLVYFVGATRAQWPSTERKLRAILAR